MQDKKMQGRKGGRKEETVGKERGKQNERCMKNIETYCFYWLKKLKKNFEERYPPCIDNAPLRNHWLLVSLGYSLLPVKNGGPRGPQNNTKSCHCLWLSIKTLWETLSLKIPCDVAIGHRESKLKVLSLSQSQKDVHWLPRDKVINSLTILEFLLLW